MQLDRMKMHLATTLLRMSETNDISKISVSSLCKEAGVARPTFYNHFKDMADLICYTGTLPATTTTESFLHIQTTRRIFSEALKQKCFFVQLARWADRNSFWDTLIDWSIDMHLDFFVHAGMPEAEQVRLSYTIVLWCSGFYNAFRRWCAEGMTTPVDIIVDTLYQIAPDFIRDNMAEPPKGIDSYPKQRKSRVLS